MIRHFERADEQQAWFEAFHPQAQLGFFMRLTFQKTILG